MKKLLILFIFISVVISVTFVFLYNSPDVFIAITKPVNADEPMYFEQIIIGGNGRFNLPVPQYIKERLNNINSKANEIEQEIFQKYETAHIETSIIIENGNTILIYSGSGINKETQAPEKYNQEIVFDFIATRNIIADNQSVMTTIGTDTAAEGESGFISSTLPNTTIQEDFESTISEKNSSAPALTSSKSLITSNELSTPQKLLFISNNNENVCSLDTTTQVMAKVNAYINSGTIRAMRMAVSDDTISNIKSNQKCIEIIYETTQSLHTSAINGASADYKFNKILLVLNGDYKGLLFFEQSGTYLSGPIKGSSEKYISDILTICS